MHAHELPTHLQVEDKVAFGLTARQILVLALSLGLGYLGFQHSHLSLPVLGERAVLLPLRIVCGVLPLVAGIGVTFLQLLGRPLEQWLLVWVRYLRLPHHYLWQPPRAARSPAAIALAELQSLAPSVGEASLAAERVAPRGSGLRATTYAEVQHGR